MTSLTARMSRRSRVMSGVGLTGAPARDAAARNERALTQRDESLARTSKDFEAAATSEIEALK